MDILVADDESLIRLALEHTLTGCGHKVTTVEDGEAAWELLRQPDGPRLAILDWAMPGLDGVDICRRVRQLSAAAPPYLILLTAMGGCDNVVAGLDAGADEYLVKPIEVRELRARVRAAERILDLEHALSARVAELTTALEAVRRLQMLLPVCVRCKRMRSDREYWRLIVEHMEANPEADFSLNVCRDCLEEAVRHEVANLPADGPSGNGEPSETALAGAPLRSDPRQLLARLRTPGTGPAT